MAPAFPIRILIGESLAMSRDSPSKIWPLKSVWPVESFANIQLFPSLACNETVMAPVIVEAIVALGVGEAEAVGVEIEGVGEAIDFDATGVDVFELEITTCATPAITIQLSEIDAKVFHEIFDFSFGGRITFVSVSKS